MADLFIRALIVHLVADWFLQNEWMAVNKVNVRHPAGYVHAGIHGFLLALVFPAPLAVWLGVVHWFIDLRFPLVAWRRLIRQTTDGPMAVHVSRVTST